MNIKVRKTYYKIQFITQCSIVFFLIGTSIWIIVTKKNNLESTDLDTLLAVTSAIFSFITVINKIPSSIKNQSKYLELLIKAEQKDSIYSIHTQVINRTEDRQPIGYAFLLISEQDNWSNIIDIINNKYKLNIHSTNGLINFKHLSDNPLWFPKHRSGIIPLPFYYYENLEIADESPSFTYSFNNENINLPSGIYSIRFYIFPDDNERYHRSTVGSLIIS